MAKNLIGIAFTIVTFNLTIFGGLISLCKNYLPISVRQTFCYGKFAEKMKDPLVTKLEVPKRWYQHFYLLAAPLSASALFLAANKYYYNGNVPEYIFGILNFLLGSDRKPSVPLANTLLALTLFTIHCSRRIYETQFVNIFSDAKINITHYGLGFLHYISVIAVILGESEGFVRSEMNFNNTLKIKDWISASIFLWMTFQQLKSNIILSNLRKDKKGVVVTKEYKIPTGGLFDCISAPLQFTEIGMYAALQIILCKNTTFLIMFVWVFINQFLSGLLSHQWLKKTFKDYPPSRKIIIPYLI